MNLWLDTETANEKPITHGTYAYASTCRCDIISGAFDDAPVFVQDMTLRAPLRSDMADYLRDGGLDDTITAHNAMFDRAVVKYALGIDTDIRRWRCTMVQAFSHGLPGGLDILCDIFKIPQDKAKHKEGRTLMLMFCKPFMLNGALTWRSRAKHPAEWQRYLAYASNDVEAMRAVAQRLPSWNWQADDIAMYHLDQTINDRGLHIDVPFAQAALRAVKAEQARLKRRTQDITGYDGAGLGVESTTQRDKMLRYLSAEHGVDLPNMQMATLERRIDDPNLPPELRELFAIRLAASSTSTGKYAAMLESAMPDHRARGAIQFCGAQRTRRDAGRKIQPQNMTRPDWTKTEIAADEPLFARRAILAGAEAEVCPDVMRAVRNSTRSAITPAPGNKLVVADLANIEGRVAAWFAGEGWKLDAFRAFDAGDGPDLYCVSYAEAFRMAVDDVDGYMRQVGKVMELMLQYEGGVGAFVTGAATYGVDLDDLAERAASGIPVDVSAEAADMWDWMHKQKRSTLGLSRRVWTVCDSLKRLWRLRHPGIVRLWKLLREGFANAVNYPGDRFEAGPFVFVRSGAWLRCIMPNGKSLCYPLPQVSDAGALSYMGVDQYSRKWSRINTYGGKVFENLCQSFAGDIIKHGVALAEDDGYACILKVHDEAVTETPDTAEFTVAALCGHLATPYPPAPGLPLAAAGYEGYFYRKG